MNLSIIIPIFNSSKNIKNLIQKINYYIKKDLKFSKFEIILVNDNSYDDSWSTILDLSKKKKFIKGINLSKNFGQHNAIMAGLSFAKGNYIITMDDDLEHSPKFLKNFIIQLNEFDACYTYYKNRKHSFFKSAISKLNNYISSFILNKPMYIYLSSFRGFKKKICKKIIKFKKNHVYIDYLILKNTNKIKMISVEHGKRAFGQGNYSIKKLFKLWSTMVLNSDLLPLKYNSIFNLFLKIIVKIFLRINKHYPQYIIKEKTF